MISPNENFFKKNINLTREAMIMNLYEKLGVKNNATKEEIKKAYRRKANKSHPDKSTGNVKEFQEIKKAFEILSDPVRRLNYDKNGTVEEELTLEEIAKQSLINMFQQLIARIQPSQLLTMDIIGVMAEEIRKKQTVVKENIKTNTRKIKEFQKLKKSIKKDFNNIFIDSIENEILKIQKNEKELKQLCEVGNILLSILGECEIENQELEERLEFVKQMREDFKFTLSTSTLFNNSTA